jgi:malate dehydrogenase (oxaloacetate-decarboxylating)
MGRDAIVFALANPTPEIMPEDAALHAKVVATGRSDYPNQINNVLCFPGIFRGALDSRAIDINEEMKLAAAYAIASTISEAELQPDYIVPSVFNRRVVGLVAAAVEDAAQRTGVARREKTFGVES